MTEMIIVRGASPSSVPEIAVSTLFADIVAHGFVYTDGVSNQTKALASEAATAAEVRAGSFWLGGSEFLFPLKVDLEIDAPGEFSAVEPITGIYGSGDSMSSALVDLRAALREHFDVLRESDALSADLADQLRLLSRHLRS